MIETKTKNNYIYKGLGFPVILSVATFRMIHGKWLLKINVKNTANIVFKALPEKPSGLTGAEIRFARTHMEMSKRGFAEHLNVSHTAVNKWEKSDQNKAQMDLLSEVALRSFIKLQASSDKEFARFYRKIMDEAKNFGKEVKNKPLEIAV